MKKKHPLCPTCKNRHPIHQDGFEWMDCMLYVKQRDNKKQNPTKVRFLSKLIVDGVGNFDIEFYEVFKEW